MKRLAAALLAFEAVCSCQLAFSTVGSWTTEAGPPTPITTNNVVALPDGRVAIFGGLSLQTGQESAQTVLYDPAHNTWTAGAPMPGPAFPDVVVALRDGTVLVEGGLPMSGATWLYDPARNSWSRAGSMLEPRSGPSFALLTDGRTLIAGGYVPLAQPVQLPNGAQSDVEQVPSAEIFDPATREWSKAGDLHTARGAMTLVAQPGGRALAAGGCLGTTGFTPPLSVAEVFDPGTLTWSVTAPMPEASCGAAGVELRDGRALLVTIGFFNSSPAAYVYDPTARRWSASGALAGGGATAVMLSDGRVFVPEVQQGTPEGHMFKDLVGGQVFDPTTDQWNYVTTTQVPLPIVYLYAGGTSLAVSLPDGTALVILQTVTLSFHPQIAPPATQLLDSTGLTIMLLAIVAMIGLLMLLAYRRAGRTTLGKLA
jgi:hypothetical protein